MARNLAFVGGERQVNLLDPIPRLSAPTANGLLGDQENPEVVALPNGNFVVVYENDAGGSGDDDILAVEFTAAGALVGDVFRVDFDAGDQRSPDVTPILTGGYAVVFEDNLVADNNNSFVSLEIVAPGSLPDPDPEFVVEDPIGPSNETYDPSIATFANGSYIVTYDRFLDAANNSDTRFAIVNELGNALLTAPTSLGQSTGHEYDTAVATFGDIAAVVYVSDELGGPLTEDIVLKIVDASGTILDTEIINTAGDRYNPEVAALADGRFVIVWADNATTDVSGLIYDPDTETFSGPEFVVSNHGGYQESPRVAALPDGGFVATWTDFSGLLGDNSAAINARRFDKNGIPVGDEFRVNTTTEDYQEDSGLAANADGVLFSAWDNFNTLNTTDTEPSGIQGQFLRAFTEVVNGTEGDDTIQTYGLGETINGLGGNDTIRAVGGNDKVDGGEGKDTVDAGPGNDTLGGGKGKGKLTGGDGDDSFLFNQAASKGNKQTITDFSHKDDTIVLDSATFKKLDAGKLANKNYFEGQADDGNDFVGYQNGKVIYDKNGDDSGGDVVIAVLKGSPDNFSKGDILVI